MRSLFCVLLMAAPVIANDWTSLGNLSSYQDVSAHSYGWDSPNKEDPKTDTTNFASAISGQLQAGGNWDHYASGKSHSMKSASLVGTVWKCYNFLAMEIAVASHASGISGKSELHGEDGITHGLEADKTGVASFTLKLDARKTGVDPDQQGDHGVYAAFGQAAVWADYDSATGKWDVGGKKVIIDANGNNKLVDISETISGGFGALGKSYVCEQNVTDGDVLFMMSNTNKGSANTGDMVHEGTGSLEVVRIDLEAQVIVDKDIE